MTEPNDPMGEPTRPAKSDNTTVAARVEDVLRIRLDGAQFHDIVQYAADNQWGVGERQLRNYIARADELLVERHERDREKLIARHAAQRAALYARSVNAADYRTALSVLDSEAKLLDLFPRPKAEGEKADGATLVTIELPPKDDPAADVGDVPDAGG